jgi:hypothetical protein
VGSFRSKACGTLLASALVFVPLTVVAPSAMADTPGCVTKAEFQAAVKGWSIQRVHNKFDTHGAQEWFFSATAYTPAEQTRECRACAHPSYSLVSVDYEKRSGVWRLTSKMAFWG